MKDTTERSVGRWPLLLAASGVFLAAVRIIIENSLTPLLAGAPLIWTIVATFGWYIVPPGLALIVWIRVSREEMQAGVVHHRGVFALLVAVASVMTLIEFGYMATISLFYALVLIVFSVRLRNSGLGFAGAAVGAISIMVNVSYFPVIAEVFILLLAFAVLIPVGPVYAKIWPGASRMHPAKV